MGIALLVSLLLSSAGVPHEPIEIPVLEQNTVFAWRQVEGRHFERCVTLEQWIVWQRYAPVYPTDTGYHVWCWRMVRKSDVLAAYRGQPMLLYRGGPTLIARQYRRTWTEYDPEVSDALVFPKRFRRSKIPGWQR